jgi:hypothetical protein
MINETLSLDSTLESPTKPNKEKEASEKKPIFLVHYMNNDLSVNEIDEKLVKNGNDEELSENKKKKVWKRGRKPKKFPKIKKLQSNILDFDLLLETFFPKKIVSPPKTKNIKKYKKKLIGYKRKKQINEIKNKSKFNIFL